MQHAAMYTLEYNVRTGRSEKITLGHRRFIFNLKIEAVLIAKIFTHLSFPIPISGTQWVTTHTTSVFTKCPPHNI